LSKKASYNRCWIVACFFLRFLCLGVAFWCPFCLFLGAGFGHSTLPGRRPGLFVCCRAGFRVVLCSSCLLDIGTCVFVCLQVVWAHVASDIVCLFSNLLMQVAHPSRRVENATHILCIQRPAMLLVGVGDLKIAPVVLA